MGKGVRCRRVVAGLAATGALLAVTTAPASAGVEDNKTYVVDIDGTVGSGGDAYAGDTDAAIAIRIDNTSPSQDLGSANVTIPAPFVLGPTSADDVPGGPVLELRDLDIAPGASLTVTVAVDVRSCTATTPAPFAITAKQSNDYSGEGNDFFLSAGSDLQVNVTGTCGLSFVAPPADAERNAAITSVDFAPAGAPITVEVRDAGNTGRATHSTASISLSAARGSIAQPLGGTTSSTAVAGLATFSPGPTIAVSASDYTMRASSTGLTTSDPSATFAIVDDQAACPANQPCATATAQKGGATVTAAFGSGANTTSVLLSIGAADAPTFSCAGYPQTPDLQVSQFVFTDDAGADRIGTMTATIPSATRPLNSYEVCWAAPYTFTTDSGAPAVQQGLKPGTSLPLYVGLLPDCPRRSSGATGTPCIQSRSYDKSTKTVALTVRATGDDPWRY